MLQDTFRFVVPAILGKFLDPAVCEEKNTQMLDLTMRIMKSGRFNAFAAAMETLLSSAIGFADSETSIKLVYKWFVTGKVTDTAGVEIEGAEINVKVRHTMVRKIFASSSLPREQKKACFAKLAELDDSDMLGRTEKYCEGAEPDPTSKRESFLTIFEKSGELGLQDLQELCRGYRQLSQRDLISSHSDDFFERIEGCVNSKAYSVTRYIYLFLNPSLQATDEELARFNGLKTRLESYTDEEKKEGTTRLLNWVKDTIQELEEKKQGRELSKAWDRAQAGQANL